MIDVLFVDIACAKPYNHDSLENDTLGGSECATVRLAEGLASKGHSVAVCQRFEFAPTTSPNGVRYYSQYWVKALKARNVVFIRAKGRWEAFPDTNKILWLHDACAENHNNITTWSHELPENSVTVVCQSDWHVKNVQQFAPGANIRKIYPILDERCIQPRQPYDNTQLVWLASPHKGLRDALRVFAKLRREAPEMKLVVFNPGYYDEPQGAHENVAFLKSQPKRVLRSVVSRSLCMFYPTEFQETYGSIAAESNALGVPVACYPVAALQESSVGPFFNSEDEVIKGVLAWRDTRPDVSHQPRFLFENIYPEWMKVLELNSPDKS